MGSKEPVSRWCAGPAGQEAQKQRGTRSEGGGPSRKEGEGDPSTGGWTGRQGRAGSALRSREEDSDRQGGRWGPGGHPGLSLFENQPMQPALLPLPKLFFPGCSALGNLGG